MFAGLVEEIGRVASVKKVGAYARLEIRAAKVLEGTKPGDSISVNGVCLTVTELKEHGFSADVMPETLRASNLGALRSEEPVNLERALKMGNRIGGHQVLGHVDTIGIIGGIRSEGNASVYRVDIPPSTREFLVPKGSVAVDGTSLTVVELGSDWLTFSLIPHTQTATILGFKREGDLVNIEVDHVAKYVRSMVAAFFDAGRGSKSVLTMEMLEDAGF